MESICCTSETNIILYASYTSKHTHTHERIQQTRVNPPCIPATRPLGQKHLSQKQIPSRGSLSWPNKYPQRCERAPQAPLRLQNGSGSLSRVLQRQLLKHSGFFPQGIHEKFSKGKFKCLIGCERENTESSIQRPCRLWKGRRQLAVFSSWALRAECRRLGGKQRFSLAAKALGG